MSIEEVPQTPQPERRSVREEQQTVFHTGEFPGNFEASGKDPAIEVFSYDINEATRYAFASMEQLNAHLAQNQQLTHWINIEGYGNTPFLQKLQDRFGLHNLALEDVVSINQRPKVDYYDGHWFIISRMLYFYEKKLINEQIAFFIFDKIVITIQDELEDCLDTIRDRILKGKGQIRSQGAAYLAYALMDAIVDNYFPMIEDINHRMTLLEESIMLEPIPSHVNEIMDIKREIIQIRKAALAERDKLNELLRSDYVKQDAKLEVYLRDAQDHSIQIVDLLEAEKEIAYSLMDVYMSNVGNKTNDIMKFLTLTSSIFIPLTFIAGVYGMNFSKEDEDGKRIPGNMPELYMPYGYEIVWGAMIAIGIAITLFFKKKKWL